MDDENVLGRGGNAWKGPGTFENVTRSAPCVWSTVKDGYLPMIVRRISSDT
jgi:hypothetical protein